MIRLLKYLKDRLVYLRSDIHFRLRRIFPTTSIEGIQLHLDDDGVLSRDLLMSVLQGGYENHENRVIRSQLLPAEKVLELGAGIGFNAIAAAKINGGKVLSYELNASLNSIISRNQALNGVQFEIRNKMLVCDPQNLHPFNFYVARNACMSSTITEKLRGFELVEKRRVETELFENVLIEWQPQFLVVDIEGGEIELFDCGDLLFKSSVKKILVEIHAEIIGPSAAAAIQTKIRNAGFELVKDQCFDEVFFFSRA